MTESADHRQRAPFAARALRKPLQAMQRAVAGVRRDDDIEHVHRLRVASRRLRNALRLFADELPEDTRDRWQKRLRAVTRRLGAARDLDVQTAFLRDFLDHLEESRVRETPGIEHLLTLRQTRRATVQHEVLAALERLEASQTLPALGHWVGSQEAGDEEDATDRTALQVEAGRAIRRRLGELFAYEPYVCQPDAVGELHAMRIAAKHLRYTLEVYAPLFADELRAPIRWARQLQDWLGEIHDCDVWRAELEPLRDELAAGPASARRLTPGIEHVLHERTRRRATVYAEFAAGWQQAGTAGKWNQFRRPRASDVSDEADPPSDAAHPQSETHMSTPLPGDAGGNDDLEAVLTLARECHYEVEHTHQVTRLAQRLFDELHTLHGLRAEARLWLTYAALLHDIGWCQGRAGHHKAALRLILTSPHLPWDERQRRFVGSIARYHRKALPSDKHAHFAALSDADRADVRTLAAILRIADALDYSHTGVVADVACHVTAAKLSIRCATTRPADVECERAIKKGDLAAEVFDREIDVTWHLH